MEEKNFNEPMYNGASSILPTMIDEYTKERERAGILDNKAIFIVTVLTALITLYIPIIPFDKIINIYQTGSKNSIILLTITVCVMIAVLLLVLFVFIKAINVIRLQTYLRVAIDDIANDSALQVDSDVAQKALCIHYRELILTNSGINDNKATKISDCFTIIIVIFMLLLCATISLILI